MPPNKRRSLYTPRLKKHERQQETLEQQLARLTKDAARHRFTYQHLTLEERVMSCASSRTPPTIVLPTTICRRSNMLHATQKMLPAAVLPTNEYPPSSVQSTKPWMLPATGLPASRRLKSSMQPDNSSRHSGRRPLGGHRV